MLNYLHRLFNAVGLYGTVIAYNMKQLCANIWYNIKE